MIFTVRHCERDTFFGGRFFSIVIVSIATLCLQSRPTFYFILGGNLNLGERVGGKIAKNFLLLLLKTTIYSKILRLSDLI